MKTDKRVRVSSHRKKPSVKRLTHPDHPPVPGVYGTVKWDGAKWEYGLTPEGWEVYVRELGRVRSVTGLFRFWYPATHSLFERYGLTDELACATEDALFRAVAKWRPDAMRLRKYWKLWAYSMARAVVNRRFVMRRNGRGFVSGTLDEGQVFDSCPASEEKRYDLVEAVAVAGLEERSVEIFRLRFDAGHSLQEIGNLLHISKERVNQIIRRDGRLVVAALGWEVPTDE